jgi:FMN-dependent NADH-azoreductase
MKNILVVKANNRPDGISTKMYDTYMDNINKENVNVETFDVYAQEMPYIGQTLFDAFGKLGEGVALNDQEAALMAVRQEAMDKFAKADRIVFAFPMWNLTIPAALHTFIDYIFAADFTFGYNADGSLKQPMADKEIVLLNARGGVYSGDLAPMETSATFMQTVFGGMFGMNIVDQIIIEGHAADPANAEQIIADGLAKVAVSAKAL